MRNPVRVLTLAVVGLILVLIAGRAAALFYTDVLWFQALGHSGVFWTRITATITVRLVTSAVAAGIILVNLWLVLRQLGPVHLRRRYGNLEFAERVPRTMLLAAAAVAAILAGWWLSSIQFGGNTPVAVLAWLRHSRWELADPVFGHDASFYLFTLPIYARFLEYLLVVVMWSALLVTIGYVLVGAVRVRGNRWEIDDRPRTHFALLAAAAFVVLGVRVYLSRYEVMLQGTGVAGVIGYTDVHARLPARFVISVLLVVAGASIVYGVMRRLWAPPLLALGTLLLATVGMGVAYPEIVQKVTVEPNQLARESEYIRWNLEFTRRAYGLDRIERRSQPYRRADRSVWSALAPTLQRLPLWDAMPLQTVFNETDAGYRYYHFPDVDYDRYGAPGSEEQVAIGVREFTPEGVGEAARTWQNMHMNPVYTRGIGSIVTPAAEKLSGDPVYWLRDIAPVKRSPAAPIQLELTQPSVYFGETMSEYAIVGYGGTFAVEDTLATSTVPDAEVTTGIPLGSFMRVLAFASRFSEPNLLFTGNLTDNTRLIFRRDIVERVRVLAPFLIWDPDALPVVLDGRILWLLHGYTASSNYPLARATAIPGAGTVRYLRSSVKATVDAVTGEVRMYALPDPDPILRTYRAIFPELIGEWDALPAGVRPHLRYPPLLFQVQASVLDEYHIEEPQAFFSGQDMWQLPQDIAPQETSRFRPGYMLAALPGRAAPEFVLMQPFIARQRQNMTALLTARSDAPHYGELVLLLMPRDDQIKGPSQVQTIIEQDPFIAQQLSLWRQGGRTVTMGQLRILPTDSSVVYVRPLFLSAAESGIPQLQRVIVSDGTAVSMADDLGAAIAGLGADFVAAPRAAPDAAALPAAGADAWRLRALELMREADERLRAGDFAGFGAAWNELRALLERQREESAPR
ncbi:MAG TPA: UPF0182 family protein [Longimicrobiales bacterium]|nr:UPF0182 family protein [Longimicrobiales bacterium]